MAKVWAVAPPFESWRGYSTKLAEFASARISKPQHTRPEGSLVVEWLTSKLPELEQELSVHPPAARLREYNTVIAKELLPVFEADPWAWRSVRYLHTSVPSEAERLVDFMHRWFLACPPEDRQSVGLLAQRLGLVVASGQTLDR